MSAASIPTLKSDSQTFNQRYIREWPRILIMCTGLLGLLLLLCGVVFFFAFNWAELDRLTKLGIAVVPVTLLGGLTLLARWHPAGLQASRWLALLAALSLVVPLALYGQVYQSTADSWLLFALWALFALPFVLADRFAVSYVALALLLLLTVFLFTEQNLEISSWRDDLSWVVMSAAAILLHILFLIFQKRLDLANSGWPARLLAGLAILPLWIQAMIWLVNKYSTLQNLSDILSLILLPLLCAIWLLVFIRQHQFDFFYVALPVYLLVLMVPAALIPRIANDIDLPGLFIVFLIFVILTSLATVMLLGVRKKGGL